VVAKIVQATASTMLPTKGQFHNPIFIPSLLQQHSYQTSTTATAWYYYRTASKYPFWYRVQGTNESTLKCKPATEWCIHAEHVHT